MTCTLGRCSGLLALVFAAGGCAGSQPYLDQQRLRDGLVMVFTGIEGRGPLNRDICHGLDDGGVKCGIELVDWTVRMPGAYLVNLRNEARNRDKADEIAGWVLQYRRAYPHRPVVLVGQSGGGAIATWVAEALPQDEQVDGIILLAAALSPGYRLDTALRRSRRGIVSFHSRRDWVFLAAGTTCLGTMDGKHSSSAGRAGFEVPADPIRAGLYKRLFQVAWHEQMVDAGHFGGHLTSGSRPLVSRYVAPLVRARQWDHATVKRVLEGQPVRRATGPAEEL